MKRRIKLRCRWHPVAGVATPFAVLINSPGGNEGCVIAIMAFAGFMLYQLYQDRNNARNNIQKADSHKDIGEYLYGLFAAIPVMLAVRFVL